MVERDHYTSAVAAEQPEDPLNPHLRLGLTTGTRLYTDKLVALIPLIERRETLATLLRRTYDRDTTDESAATTVRHTIFLNWGIRRWMDLDDAVKSFTNETPVFLREQHNGNLF